MTSEKSVLRTASWDLPVALDDPGPIQLVAVDEDAEVLRPERIARAFLDAPRQSESVCGAAERGKARAT